ncbi:MAG: hypothetical protein ABIP50_01915 [Candidatus Saccharimonadales bacterium]
MSTRKDSYTVKRSSAGKQSTRSSRKSPKGQRIHKRSAWAAQVHGNAKRPGLIAHPNDELIKKTLCELINFYHSSGQKEVFASIVADLSSEGVRLIVEIDGPRIKSLRKVRDPYDLVCKALKLKRRLNYEAAKDAVVKEREAKRQAGRPQQYTQQPHLSLVGVQ